MPELPEVETTKEGIKLHLQQQYISEVIVRNHRLRMPVPDDLAQCCVGKQIKTVSRRAKYILIHLSQGYLLVHLGMSGHLRIVPQTQTAEKHDHIDLLLSNGLILRYCDPRRFGMFFYIDDNPYQHKLLSHLGPEPLTDAFNGDYLLVQAKNRTMPVKSFIMTNSVVVGVGNIYAAESLYLAGIHPLTPAKNINLQLYAKLSVHIKEVLATAIKAGGTTLRDFYAFDGKPGYFSQELKVYGRKNKPCVCCETPIDSITIGGRQSSFCTVCQPYIDYRRGKTE